MFVIETTMTVQHQNTVTNTLQHATSLHSTEKKKQPIEDKSINIFKADSRPTLLCRIFRPMQTNSSPLAALQ